MPQKTRTDTLAAAKDTHIDVLLPLADKARNLEIALTYLRQALRWAPACQWHLDRAIDEIEDARRGIMETQQRAVEYWKNNYR